MILLNVQQISKSFGVTTILENINMTISERDRIGLVGVNGAGKTTLLKIITGEYLPDSGKVSLANGRTMGHLAQDSGLDSDKTIWDEMLTVFHDLILMENEMRRLEMKMGDASNKLLDEYDRLSTEFQERGGYSYQAQIRSLLTGFGFAESCWQDKISSLSGGQKTRLAMVKLLLAKPDLLILDEPTNHLDITTLTWLENYLQNYDGALLVVSHDRYFLDRIVTSIYEIERTHIKQYHGNYTYYQQKKKEEYEIALKQYQHQQEEIKRLEDFVQRNIARASTTKRAQSRRKTLEKMERLEKPVMEQTMSGFTFEIERTSGNDVLTVRDLTIGYGKENPIVSKINFRIERNERVAIVGPNGIGKSTLLKTLCRRIQPIHGEIQWGSQIKIGYYDQELSNLNGNKRVIDEIWDEYSNMLEVEVRSLLGRFLFSGEEVEKPVAILSGGEKARLSLAKLLLTKANVLLLDEPTNHLDLYSKEALEQALLEYPGTLIFISHDRYFLNRISTRTLELSETGVISYLGNYDYYLEKKKESLELQQNNEETKKSLKAEPSNFSQMKELKKVQRKLERTLEELELEIQNTEEKIQLLELESCKPEVFQDYGRSLQIQSELNELQEKLETAMERWEQVSLELEALRASQS